MRIAAAIGVIDEVECLAACVRHHRSMGVCGFVITDLGSTDGTAEILERLKRDPDVRVLQGRQNLSQPAWPQAMQQCAYEAFDPDYIVYIDPDEFWLPASGRLDHAWDADVIAPLRYNVVPDPSLSRGEWRMHERLADRIIFRQRLTFSPEVLNDVRTPVIRYAPGPKVMHRAVPASIERGWHAAGSPLLRSRVCPEDVVVVHFPVSTWDRFRRKAENAAQYLQANQDRLGATEAWHWRIWVRALHDGRLRDCYDSQVFSPDQIAGFLRDGIACPAANLLSPGAA